MSFTREQLAVFIVRKGAVCDECKAEIPSGGLLRSEHPKGLCMACADLNHLLFLPRGDTALTRRSSKHSRLRAVVLKWSSSRKRWERQGLLVERQAIAKARVECETDSAKREAQREKAAVKREREEEKFVTEFARKVRERYPSSPDGIEEEIAGHACEKYSGRVGRSEMAKGLSELAIDLAVRAHIRHNHTDYDDLLMSGWNRQDACDKIVGDIERVMRGWRAERRHPSVPS